MSFLKAAIKATLNSVAGVSVENTEMNNVTVTTEDGNDVVLANGDNNNIDVGSDTDVVFVSGNNNNVGGSDGSKTTLMRGDNNNVDYTGNGEQYNTSIEGNNNNFKAGNGSATTYVSGDNNNIQHGTGAKQDFYIEGNKNNLEAGNATVRSMYLEGDRNTAKVGDGETYLELVGDFDDIEMGNGNKTIYITGDDNAVVGQDGETYSEINGDSNKLQVKDGNAYLEVYGDKNDVSTGNGDKTVYVTGDNNKLSNGDGNSYVEIEGNANDFSIGNGDKTALIKGDSNIYNSGDGEAYLEMNGNNNRFTTGDGNQTVYMTGDGNGYVSGDGQVYAEIKGNSNSATMGDGDKTIYLTGNSNALKTGDGETYAEFKGNSNNIEMGSGDKTIYMNGDYNNMTVADGNVYMELDGDSNKLKFGNGDNVLGFIGDKNSVEMGDGNNYVAFWGDSNSIKAGNGDNFIESLDLALQKGNFSNLYNAWEATLPRYNWEDWVLIDTHVSTSSSCFGLKKKTTITYTYRVDTYLRRNVNGPTNSNIELGNGNNTVTITGDKSNNNKVKAGTGNNKITDSKKWYWDELQGSRIERRSVSKSSWNWTGIVTLGLSAICPPIGGLVLGGLITDTLISVPLTGKAYLSEWTGKALSVVSPKVGKDFQLFEQGIRENEVFQVGMKVATVAAAVVATVFTAGAAAPLIAGAVGTVAGATVGTVAGATIGGALAGTAGATISAVGMAGADGRQLTMKELGTAVAAGAVGGIFGGAAAVGAAAVGASSAVTAITAGAVGGGTGAATSSAINGNFKWKEVLTSAAIGAASGLATTAVGQGWTAGKNAYAVARANGDGVLSSFGQGVLTGTATTINTATGGLLNVASNILGTQSITSINQENALLLEEYNLENQYNELDRKITDLTDKYANNQEMSAQDKSLYNSYMEQDAALSDKLAAVRKELYGYEVTNTTSYDANGNLNINVDVQSSQNTRFSNPNSWVENYNNYHNNGDNFMTSAVRATFQNSIYETPLTVASNVAYNTGSAVVNTAYGLGQLAVDGTVAAGKAAWNGISTVGSAIYDGAAYVADATWSGMKTVGNGIANTFNKAVDGTKNLFNSTSNAVSEQVNSFNNSNSNSGLLTKVSNFGQTVLDKMNGISNSFVKGLIDCTGIPTIYESVGQVGKYLSNNQYGWGSDLKYTIGNTFNSENAYGLKTLYELSGAKALMSSANNTVGYMTGYRANSEALFGTNSWTTDNNLWNDISGIYNSTSANNGNLLQQAGHMISDAGQKVANVLNSGTTLISKIAGVTGLRGTVNMLGATTKFVFGNNYGWGNNLKYTIPGLLNSNSMSSAGMYVANGAYELSGAKAFVNSIDNSVLYMSDNNLDVVPWNDIDAVDTTIVDDYYTIKDNLIGVYDEVSSLTKSTIETVKSYELPDYSPIEIDPLIDAKNSVINRVDRAYNWVTSSTPNNPPDLVINTPAPTPTITPSSSWYTNGLNTLSNAGNNLLNAGTSFGALTGGGSADLNTVKFGAIGAMATVTRNTLIK